MIAFVQWKKMYSVILCNSAAKVINSCTTLSHVKILRMCIGDDLTENENNFRKELKHRDQDKLYF